MYRATYEWYELFSKDTCKTYMRHDWGKEFACYLKVDADLNIPVDLTDTYSSSQRGGNETDQGLF